MPTTPSDSETALPTPVASTEKSNMSGPSRVSYKTLNDLRARDVFQTTFQRASDGKSDKQLRDLSLSTKTSDLSSDLHGLSSNPSSPITSKRDNIHSSPPFKPVEFTQSSPDINGTAAFTTESSTSPATPPVIPDERPMSDMSFIPSKPFYIASGSATKAMDAATPKDFVVPSNLLSLSSDTIKDETDEECKAQLILAVDLLRQASSSIDKYKGLVSQLKLQNQLLTIETHEAAQRFEVEKSLVKREVDRLRYEQIDHQNYMAAAVEHRSDSDTYRRRLHKTKLKLRDANKEIEERDKEIAMIKKRLREGRLHREALEEALLKGKELHRAEEERRDSTPPPRGNLFGSSSSMNPSTPPSTKPRAGLIRQNGESGLDTLGFLASQALFEQQQQRPQGSESPESLRNKSVPAVSADYPRFDNKPGAVNLPPLRLPHPSDSNTKGGLMSPVAFKEGPFSANSSPPTASHAMLAATLSPEKRRHSNASTITVPSDDERLDEPTSEIKQERQLSDSNRRVVRQRSTETMPASSGMEEEVIARQGKVTRSPRKRLSATSGISKSISRSGSGNVSAAFERSPRTPAR